MLLESSTSENNKRVERSKGEFRGRLKWSDGELAEHKEAEAEYRKEVVGTTIRINEEFKKMRQDRWDKALTKLSSMDPKKAAKENWRTINKLSGKGKKSEPPSMILYKGVTASGHKVMS